MGTSILANLRAKYPKAKITAMCRAPLGELLEKDPNVDEIFSFKEERGAFRRKVDRSIIDKLKQGHYDLGILLTNSLSSAWLFWQGHIKIRLGFRKGFRSLLLTHACQFPKNVETTHLVNIYEQLLLPLGECPSLATPTLYVDESEVESAKHVLKTYGITDEHIVIGINPGAAYGSAKCWLPERFKEVALKLLELNPLIRIVFFGNELTAPLVKTICYQLPPEAINLAASTSLRDLMALIKRCQVLLTNDSGPMHIADALNVPLIALFGSTNPIKTGPYHQMQHVLKKQVECSPCYKRECPIDFRCMKEIKTEDVYGAIVHLLKSYSLMS